MDREFEKISFENFKKSICDDKKLYDEFPLPRRATEYSAGYDFVALNSGLISPGKSCVFKTGVRVRMQNDEVLLIFDRSSLGFKHDVFLSNSVGVIDSDYYYSDNEGHICIKLINMSNEDFFIDVGDKIAQGIFIKYLTTGDNVSTKRNGGFGSTGKGEKNE